MVNRSLMREELGRVFADQQAEALSKVIYNAYNNLVRADDFNELKGVVRDLAEAQQRTEHRVEELAEAQQRTEYALQQLARQVGGLSDRMGGDLEDVAAIVIHDALEREFGWQIDELDRSWQMWDGVEEEIDVFGQAHDSTRPDTRLWIVGEVKFNLTMRDMERFALLVDRATRRLDGEIVPVCFSYRVRPAVREAVKKVDYRLVFSNGRML